jgi:DNA-binding MarR family transcriptional regulator
VDLSRLLELVELVSRKMHRFFVPIVEAEGVSIPELIVLRKIHDHGTCRVTELAEEIGIAPSTLTGITDRLVSKGLLTRGPDLHDRRAVLLGAGEELPALLQRVQAARKERLAGVFNALTPAVSESLIAGLDELLKGLEREEGESS